LETSLETFDEVDPYDEDDEDDDDVRARSCSVEAIRGYREEG